MSLAVELFANLYDAFIGVLFVSSFNKVSFFKNKLGYFAIALIFAVSTAFTFIDDYMLLHSGLILLILYLYSFFMTKSFNLRSVLAPLIFERVLIFSSTVIVFSLSEILKLNLTALSGGLTFPRILFLVLCKLVISFALMIINRFFSPGIKFKPVDLILYLFSPLMTIITFYTFISMSLNGDVEKYYVLMFISSFGLIIVNILALFFFTRYSKSELEKSELVIMQKLSDAEGKRYLEIEKIYDSVRVMRHDIKDQLFYAEQLVENKEIEKAKSHLKTIEEKVDKTYDFIHTGNRVFDNILYSNISLHKEIKFIVTGTLKNLSFIDDVKLVSLFGNMIDNAVEYVSKQVDEDDRIIEINFSFVSGYQNIECKNPISASVMDSNPDLKTTKSKKE